MKAPRFLDSAHSIHAKITFWVMLTVLIVFSIITIIITRFTQNALFDSSKENAMNRMEISNQHINSVLVAVEVAVENAIPDIEQNLKTPDALYAVVRSMLKMNPIIVGSAVAFEANYFPAKGEFFSPYAYRTVDDSIEVKQLGTEDYDYLAMDWYLIPKLLKQNYWSEPYYDSGGGEQTMTTYSHPLYDANGEVYAILTADVSLNWLTDMVKKNDIKLNQALFSIVDDTAAVNSELKADDDFFATRAYTYIIGRGGSYIAHPLTERILNDTYFSICMTDGDSLGLKIGYDMIDGKKGISTMERDNINYTICYAPVERTGWAMSTVIPTKMILQKARTTGIIISLLMLLGLIVVYFVCSKTMRRITRPLERFATSADEIAKGNLDASLPEIKSDDEMRNLHDSFLLMQTSLKEQMEELKHTTASKAAIESELKVASDIQMSMIPKIHPAYPDRDDIDVFGQLTPAKAVGGDLFDFYIRDEKLFFCIGDVSGKGVPAALVMAVTRAQFRTVSAHESQPERIVARLNETMCEGNESMMFVTLFVGVLDLPTGRLRYCNAGHDAPFIIGHDATLLPCDSNLPVGIMPDMKFSVQEAELPPMSTIFLYTDGLTEAENGSHKLFGEERIQMIADAAATMKNNQPEKLVGDMTGAVKQFVDGADQSDDLTMLAIQYTKKQLMVSYQKNLTLDNDISQVPVLTEFVETACNEVGFDPATTMSINLAMEEAVVNVMSYAYPAGTKGLINIDAIANKARLKFIISDNGVPFDPTVVAEADTTLSAEERNIGGLGIFLVRQIMDSVNYERIAGFNVLTLRKKIPTGESRQEAG